MVAVRRLLQVIVVLAALVAVDWGVHTSWDALRDDAVLAYRGVPVGATVVDLTDRGGGRPDTVELAFTAPDDRVPRTAWTTTYGSELDVGQRVDAVVDPDDWARAQVAGEGWPWVQVFTAPLVILLAAVLAYRLVRWLSPRTVTPDEAGRDRETDALR